MRWREREGMRVLEAELPGARASFTTRLGGVSSGPFESLNLGILTGDEPEAVRENRQRAARGTGVEPASILIGRQVHGAEIEIHDGALERNPFGQPEPRLREVDGHATATAGLAPLVFVADCLPIALAGPRGVAMVHGGWRGLAAGIIERGVAAVGAEAAAIGPGIGPCCYEVGAEVLHAFAPLGDGFGEGPTLDLAAVARAQLDQAGVGQVEDAGLCTSCNSDLFFSHRRDRGTTGRQAGLVVAQG